MATNLRLSEQAAAALRDEAERSGRSQQALLREAVDRYLGRQPSDDALDRTVATGLVKAPAPFRDITPKMRLAEGVSALDLLDRDGDR